MDGSGSDGAARAAARLAFESQFTALREVLEGIPGITGTLPQLSGQANSLHDAGGWMMAFDIDPSQLGIDALVGLTETLEWCQEHHEELGLPEFEAVVFFAAGFLLRVTPDGAFNGGGLAVAPDVLARAIHEHYEQCVAANEEQVRQWGQLEVECTEDCRRSRPDWNQLDSARFTFDLIDGDNDIVAVFLDGRPVGWYEFADGEGRLEWRRCDPSPREGGGSC